MNKRTEGKKKGKPPVASAEHQSVQMPQSTTTVTGSIENILQGSAEFSGFLKDRDAVLKLIRVMELLHAWNPRMELQQVQAALYCFYLSDEDRNPGKLGELMDLPSSTISRNLSQLSGVGIKAGETHKARQGFGWIKLEEDPEYRIRKNITVTHKGSQFRRMLAAIIRGEAV
jgi:DNA-binding MarR family transcriptional regulator